MARSRRMPAARRTVRPAGSRRRDPPRRALDGRFAGDLIALQRRYGNRVTTRLLAVPTTVPVLQAKWVKSTSIEDMLEWDASTGTTTWFYNPKSGHQFYRTSKGERSDERPYLDWLKAGAPGLKDRQLAADRLRKGGIDPRAETSDETFYRYRNEGRALFAGIGSPGGDTKGDKAWSDHYAKHTEVEDPYWERGDLVVDVKTGFKASYLTRMQDHDGTGRYHNKFKLTADTSEGAIVAVDNHRAKKEEREPLNNSEVMYQQYVLACKKAGQKATLRSLKRKNVINKTLEPILRELKGQTTVVTSKDDLFYVLLSTPNVKVAAFMIKDRGKLLGISTIDSITVEKKDVTINFK